MPSFLDYEGPTVLFEHVEDKLGALIEVSFAGIMPNEKVELSVLEVGDGERKVGTVKGKLLGKLTERLGLQPDAPQAKPAPEPNVRLRFKSQAGTQDFTFALTGDQFDKDEGSAWRIKARLEGLGAESPTIALARVRRQVEGPGATYDWHAGHDATFYNDASTDEKGSAGAFCDLLKAIDDAKHFVFVVDWSFHPLFCPSRKSPAHRDHSIGSILLRKAANKELLVAIHTWSHTDAAAADPANDEEQAPFTLQFLAKAMGLPKRPDNVLWRATSRTGSSWTHHQKFVVLDAPGAGGRRDLRVFWGGLDITKGRFDWPGHEVAVDSPNSQVFRQHWGTRDGITQNEMVLFGSTPMLAATATDDWYNAEFVDDRNLPRQPWHDIHGSLQGPIAWDFVREFVGRWTTAPSAYGDHGDLDDDAVEKVWKVFRKLYEQRDTFLQQYEGKRTGPWSAQMYRSLTLQHWKPIQRDPRDALDHRLFALLKTKVGGEDEHSIQLAYRHNIMNAERFIYIENQYFIGSGKHWDNKSITNNIPELLVDRILERHAAGKPFHVYIVMPMFPEGDPVGSGGREVRRNEWLTIEYMVKRLEEQLKDDWSDYLSFYFLANWRVTPKNRYVRAEDRKARVRGHMRYMVYVHSKFMLIDDRYVLFGSCNINDRGLRGSGDSEVAAGIWPSHGERAAADAIKEFRHQVWREHFGGDVPGWDAPEQGACVDELGRRAANNYWNLRTMGAAPTGHICRIPLSLNKSKRLTLNVRGPFPEDWKCLPDAPQSGPEWVWSSDGSRFLKAMGWAE